jgi:predicted ATPase
MLRSLYLENFKCFGRPTHIPLAPITLIYGPNSGGKSSIIQSLVLMRQTLSHGAGTHSLVPRGELVDLGSFKALLHGHSTKRKLTVAVTATPFWRARDERHLYRHLGYHEVGMKLRFGAATSPGSRKLDSSKLIGAEYSVREFVPPRPIRGVDVVVREPRSMRLELVPSTRKAASPIHQDGATSWEFTADSVEAATAWVQTTPTREPMDEAYTRSFLQSCVTIADGLLPRIMFQTEEWQRSSQAGDAVPGFLNVRRTLPLEDVARTLERAFLRLSYLGPLRIHPARYYDLASAGVDTVGKSGENAPQVIFRRGSNVTKEINRWFEMFDVPYKLRTRKLGDEVTGHILAITLVDKRSGLVVGPSDVGFGIGQLLPIIVEGVVSESKTICVEQPEIHLHPRLQAYVADLLIGTADIHADARPSARCGTQWIVETHSEALVLRLQRRIREGALRSKDVSILYVEPSANGSVVHQLRLNSHGEFIDEWPDGFFEESFEELFGATRDE